MRNGVVSIVLGLAATWAVAGNAPAPDAARLRTLVQQLGSEHFADRERARKELEAIGTPALGPLRAALKDSDLETARRAAELVRVIEERDLSTRLLAPHKVRLRVDDVPVLDAVARLAKVAGCAIRVEGDRLPLHGKRVTLDIGTVTFWEAVDQLSAQAGLAEKITLPSMPGEAQPAVQVYLDPAALRPDRTGKRAGKRVPPPPPLRLVPLPPSPVAAPDEKPAAAAPVPAAAAKVVPGRVVLTPAPAGPRHVCYAGAARVVLRPLPPAKAAAPASGARFHDLMLAVSAEPFVLGFAVHGVPTITRAVDEHGQALAFVIDPPQAAAPRPPIEMGWGKFGEMLGQLESRPPVPSTVTVRLQAGARPARVLRELAGALTGQVLVPNSTLAVIDAPLKAKGKAVAAKGGGQVMLDTIEPSTETDYRVVLKLEGMPMLGDGGLSTTTRDNVVIIAGNGGDLQIALLDGKGKAMPITSGVGLNVESGPDGQPIGQKLEVAFQSNLPQLATARLVLTGTYAATVSVPFRFTDVPLP